MSQVSNVSKSPPHVISRSISLLLLNLPCTSDIQIYIRIAIKVALGRCLLIKRATEIRLNSTEILSSANVRAVALRYSLPLYLGTQRTVGGSPLMLKCLPSNWEHCSSLKSLRPLGHGSVLQERNFMRRPTQKRPPFLGLKKKTNKKNFHQRHCKEMPINIQGHMYSRVSTQPKDHSIKDNSSHYRLIEARAHFIHVFPQWPYSGLLQSLDVLRVPPPHVLEHTL